MHHAYAYEPLDTNVHDRAAFSCGVEPLDRYLQQQANQDIRNHVAAVYVQCIPGSPVILGYYSICSLSIEARDLPSTATKRLPRYPVLPATLIGRLAVAQHVQGKGLGGLLLFDALSRSLRAGIASMAVVVDAKDGGTQRFYERFGFQRFAGNEYRLFLSMKNIETLFP